MKVFSIDVLVFATAYVKAKSQAEAFEIVERAFKDYTYLDKGVPQGSEVEFSDACFSDPDLPTVSLSAAATIPPFQEWSEAIFDVAENLKED